MDYVEVILNSKVRVVCSTPSLGAQLKTLGAFSETGSTYFCLPYDSKQHLAEILGKLQLLSLPFGDAPAGWPPAAVFQKLRDEGLVKGNIKTITWRSPSEPVFGEA